MLTLLIKQTIFCAALILLCACAGWAEGSIIDAGSGNDTIFPENKYDVVVRGGDGEDTVYLPGDKEDYIVDDAQDAFSVWTHRSTKAKLTLYNDIEKIIFLESCKSDQSCREGLEKMELERRSAHLGVMLGVKHCYVDRPKFCAGVGGKLMSCLRAHQSELTAQCAKALVRYEKALSDPESSRVSK